MVGGLLAVALLLIVALAYAGDAYAPYYSLRLALLYPVGIALAGVGVWSARSAERRPSLDWYDLLVLLFCFWQVLCALLSPVPVLAWFDEYNRIGGAVFWVLAGLLLLAARRALGRPASVKLLAVGVAAVLILGGVTAIVQAAGGDTPWHVTLMPGGRASGTTGNAVNLAGLSLLGVWAASIAVRRHSLGRLLRALLLVASALALVGGVLSVSRAFYLGVGAALAAALLWCLLARRWRAGLALLLVAATLTAVAFAYSPGQATKSATSAAAARPSGKSVGGSAASRLAEPFDTARNMRLALWSVAVKAVAVRPLTGYGPGAFVVAYRRLVSATIAQRWPMLSVGDAHSLPLAMLACSGVPGLLLAGGVVAGAVVLVLRNRRLPGHGSDADAPSELERSLAAAAALLALAVLLYLAVSPTDPVTVVPLLLLGGAALRAPAKSARGTVALPSGGLGVGVLATVGLLVVAACGVSAYLGGRLYAADRDYLNGEENGLAATVQGASDRLTLLPQYAQAAGDLLARDATSGGQREARTAAAAMFRRSLRADPSQAASRAGLVKLDLSFRDVKPALSQVNAGLRFNPRQPILQALWAQAGLYALLQGHDTTLARSVASALTAYPDKVADGYYWLGVLDGALGDGAGAKLAAAHAHALAPTFGKGAYRKRVQGGISVSAQ